MLTKNAVGNLINRYKSVLAKCRVLNAVGYLALATVMATGGLTMGLGTAYAAYDGTPTLDDTNIKTTIDDTVKALTIGVPSKLKDTSGTTYDNWSAYATDLATILEGTTISSAYTVVTGDNYLYTFTVDGTTYGITLKNSIVGGTSTSSSIKDLITAYKNDDGYTIESTEGTGTFTVTIGDDTYYFNVMKGDTVISSLETIEGTADGNNNYTDDFIGNSNTGNGGAIYNYDATIGSIIGDFIGNSASSSASEASGGAIYNYLSTIGTIIGDFIGNSATSTTGYGNGGAIYNESSTIGSIIGDFIGNSATSTTGYGNGGAIYNAVASSTIGIIIGDFIGNSASTYGGAIYNSNSTIGSIIGDFIGNEATDGGAIYNGGMQATITLISGSYFIDNVADADGGAIYNGGGKITTISGSYFVGNEATAAGGAIYNYAEGGGATATIESITNSYFIDNEATDGGAIYNYAEGSGTTAKITTISGSYFEGNTATGTDSFGGAICNMNGTIGSIENSTFIGNSAGGSGGAIYTTRGLTFVADGGDVVFTDNYTGSSGSETYNAIYVDGEGVTLTFNLAGSGNVYMNDSVTGSSTYAVSITGTDSTGAFYLNDEMTNVDALTVTDATLALGSYLHGDGVTTTYGTISTTGDVKFEAGSTFIVDGSIFGDEDGQVGDGTITAAITGSSLATFTATDSTLKLTNVSSGNYTILSGFADYSNAWTEDQVTVANAAYGATVDDGDGTYKVTVAIDYNSSALTSVSGSTAGLLVDILESGSSGEAGYDLANGLLSSDKIAKADKGKVYEQAASGSAPQAVTAAMGTTVGAQNVITGQLNSAMGKMNAAPVTTSDASEYDQNDTSTMTASADGMGAVSDVPSTSYLKEKDLMGLNVWAMPFYQNQNTDGVKSGSSTTDSENNFGGLVLGADHIFGQWRVGLAINAGSGGISSTDGYVDTDTDYDFWGVNLYAGRSFDKLGITAQLGYSHGDYESVQDLTPYGLADQESDLTSHTYSASVRATYDLDTDFANFKPYLGLSYMHFEIEDCDIKTVGGGVAASVSTDDQDVWTIPFGVTISKDFTHPSTNGADWTLTPALKLGAIYALGDLESRTSSRVAGVSGSMPVESDVIDDWTFDAGLSLTAVKDIVTLDFGYDVQVSEHVTNHGVYARVGYSF